MSKKEIPHKARHPHQATKETMKSLLHSIKELKREGTKVMHKTVSFRSGLSLSTVGRYWKEAESKLDFPISIKEVIIDAARKLEREGTPVTKEAVCMRADVSLSSVKKYWHDVDNHLGLSRRVA